MSIMTKHKLNRVNLGLEDKWPIKIVQFGEGNFLRAFVDYAIQQLNTNANFNAGIAVVQPIDRGMVHLLNEQDGLYTLFLKGIQNGEAIQHKELITTIVKGIDPYKDFDQYLALAKEEALQFVISNTTEAGISFVDSDTLNMTPPNSFPAKLTRLLYERFQYFNGDMNKGLIIIPCELINYNSETLRDIIHKYITLWHLDKAFLDWIYASCSFHSTLVDRIVPGYPKDDIEAHNAQLPYHDQLIVTAEPFLLWVIEGDEALKEKLPFHKTNLDVKIVKDMQPYRTRKVRILNGAHTTMVPFSLLYGNETVQESIDNPFTGEFVNQVIFNEINDTLPMEREELDSFAKDVLDRFRNPFIKHRLADIALNSISKYKVRVLPSLLEFVAKNNKLPTYLTFGLACLIRFYKGTWQGKALPVQDSDSVIEAFQTIWKADRLQQVAVLALQNAAFWDRDLTEVHALVEAVTLALEQIETHGIEQGLAHFKEKY